MREYKCEKCGEVFVLPLDMDSEVLSTYEVHLFLSGEREGQEGEECGGTGTLQGIWFDGISAKFRLKLEEELQRSLDEDHGITDTGE